MQTKKRAKSVSFGKSEVKKKKEIEEPKKIKIVPESASDEKEVKIVSPVEEDTDTVAEIKQTIEEKLQTKEEAEAKENQPEEIDLTTEDVTESQDSQNDEVAPIEPEEPKSAFGSFTNDYEARTRKKGNNIVFFFVIVIITFIVGLGIIEGVYYLTKQKIFSPQDINLIPKAKPTPTLTVQPTPTTKPVDLSAYTIKVLNGSGTTGEAAKVKSSLTEAGFTVDEVGNADASDYTTTIIAAKKTVSEAYLKALVQTLSKSYKVDEHVTTLSETSTSDVTITIGSDTAQ